MVLKMKDTNSACLSAVPHVPHLAKFLMPFYKCWAGAGWQQCKRPFLTQGVGRWFQRYWFFESGFCPDCVWFLPFRPPLLTNEMTHVLLPFMPSTECSDLDSGNPNLVFKLSKSQYSDTTTYCKIQPTSPYLKLFIYCQKYKSNIKMLQSLCSQSTCLTKASVSLNVLTQNWHWVLFLFKILWSMAWKKNNWSHTLHGTLPV